MTYKVMVQIFGKDMYACQKETADRGEAMRELRRWVDDGFYAYVEEVETRLSTADWSKV